MDIYFKMTNISKIITYLTREFTIVRLGERL